MMRALTMTQPWCGLVAAGLKLVENRPRPIIKRADFGKPFALHASREVDEAVYARIHDIDPDLRVLSIDRHPKQEETWYRLSRITSAVIAVATVDYEIRSDAQYGYVGPVDVPPLGDQCRWFFGPVGYVLRDVRALATPVPCRGWQGFWALPPDVETQVRAQLARTA